MVFDRLKQPSADRSLVIVVSPLSTSVAMYISKPAMASCPSFSSAQNHCSVIQNGEISTLNTRVARYINVDAQAQKDHVTFQLRRLITFLLSTELRQ